MGKLAKLIITGVVILLVAGGGAAVLATAKLPFGGEVTFELVDAIAVYGDIKHGGNLVDKYEYDGLPENKPSNWSNIPDIYLTKDSRVVYYYFRFDNIGSNDVKVTILPPLLEDNGFTLTGGYIVSGTDKNNYVYAEPVDGYDTAPKIEGHTSAEFLYTLTLVNTNSSSNASINFSVRGIKLD